MAIRTSVAMHLFFSLSVLTEKDGDFDLSWKHVLGSCPPSVVEFLNPEARVVLLGRLKV